MGNLPDRGRSTFESEHLLFLDEDSDVLQRSDTHPRSRFTGMGPFKAAKIL